MVNANIANITPDDTAVDGKPWTSKHIVDMLCPPLEVTGNPVQCYPVPGYPLGITASWEPVQEGEGDPSPDNIRPIKGRKKVAVGIYVGNIITTPYMNKSGNVNGVQFTVNDDGSVTIEGTATETVYFNLCTNNILKSFINKGLYSALDAPKEVAGFIISGCTLQVRDTDVIMYIVIGKGATVNRTVFPMVLVGSTIPQKAVTPSPQNKVTLTLPETIYGGSVDAVTGEGQRKWRLITLTGNESWMLYWSIPGIFWIRLFNKFVADESYLTANALADRYKGVTRTDIRSHLQTADLSCAAAAFELIIADKNHLTLDEWKAYLAAQYAAGTPVQIAYKLATPASFQSDGASDLSALAGINTILTDADSVAVTARKDPVHLFDGLSS